MGYDRMAPKRPVNMSLNEDLVAQARRFTGNLSDTVEHLPAEFLEADEARRMAEDRAIDAAIERLNAFDAEHGAFTDRHSPL